MLVRLLPDDIEKGWDVISKALIGSVPEYVKVDDIGMTNILYALLNDTLQCWLITGDNFKERGMHGIVTTTVVVDEASQTKNLLIYSFRGYRMLTQDIMNDFYITLKTFAKSKNCYKIIAYTEIERIKTMIINMGGRVGHTLVELEI